MDVISAAAANNKKTTIVTEAIREDKNTFQKEQNDLLKFILGERFFKPWSLYRDYGEEFDRPHSLFDESSLEIYITSSCNQKCEYCYLQQFPLLYPKEYNNKALIMKNLDILYNWLIENRYRLHQIEFYTGEIWQGEWGLEVLEATYQAIKRGLQVESFLIPSNCSFVMNESQLNKIQKYINKFQREFNIPIIFSISVDGQIIESDTRPLNSGEVKTDAYYERLFLFAAHNKFFFHPMVAAYAIERWIENYDWWDKMCKEYGYNVDEHVMMLEVRNNDWTEEKIQHYLNFLDYMMEKRFNDVGGDAYSFMKDLFCFGGEGLHGYVPYAPAQADNFAGCSIPNSLTVRLGDLAICPCHRTAYNKFLYGWFKVEDDKIVDIIANNPQMAVRVLMANNNLCSFGCDDCAYAAYCLKGCYGSQYENVGDPFMPVPGVCNFFKEKWRFIIRKYEELGVIEECKKINPYHEAYVRIQEFLNFVEGVNKDVKQQQMAKR